MTDKPNLGLATTKELIDELAARAHVSANIGEKWPNYSTVGGERELAAAPWPVGADGHDLPPAASGKTNGQPLSVSLE